jgi:hypothetical protein
VNHSTDPASPATPFPPSRQTIPARLHRAAEHAKHRRTEGEGEVARWENEGGAAALRAAPL